MHPARIVPVLALGGLLAIALAACSAGAQPGWTFAPMRLKRTSGVSPTVSRIESLMSAWRPVADVLMGVESRGRGRPSRSSWSTDQSI